VSYTPIPNGSGPGGLFAIGDLWTPAIGNIVRDNFNDEEVRIAALATGIGSVLLATRTASSSNTLDFLSVLSSTYDEYEFVLEAIVAATDAANLRLLFSKDNGLNWEGSNYSYAGTTYRNSTVVTGGNTGQTSITVANTGGTSSTAARGGQSGTMRLFRANSTTQWKNVTGQYWIAGSDGNYYGINSSGAWHDVSAINAVRFQFSSGAITSGVIKCYGLKK